MDQSKSERGIRERGAGLLSLSCFFLCLPLSTRKGLKKEKRKENSGEYHSSIHHSFHLRQEISCAVVANRSPDSIESLADRVLRTVRPGAFILCTSISHHSFGGPAVFGRVFRPYLAEASTGPPARPRSSDVPKVAQCIYPDNRQLPFFNITSPTIRSPSFCKTNKTSPLPLSSVRRHPPVYCPRHKQSSVVHQPKDTHGGWL